MIDPAERPDPIAVFLVDDQQLVRGGFRMLIEAQPDMVVVGEAGDGAQAVASLTRGRVRADVVLMDIRMPVMDGVQATRQLLEADRARDAPRAQDPAERSGCGPDRAADSPADGAAASHAHAARAGAQGPRPGGSASADGAADGRAITAPKVLVLTTFDLDEYVFAALRAGASGFLLKDARPDELLSAIRSVAAGDAVVAPSATRRLLQHVVQALPPTPPEPDPRLDSLTAREREVLLQVAAGATNAEIAAALYLAEATVKTHIGHLLAKLECRDRVGLVVLAYTNGLVRG